MKLETVIWPVSVVLLYGIVALPALSALHLSSELSPSDVLLLSTNARHTYAFLALSVLMFVCYGLTAVTHPGSAAVWERERPDIIFPGFARLPLLEPELDVEGQRGPLSMEGLGSPGKKHLPFCSYCEMSKPPRVSHCRSCDRCILRYDHFCVWMTTCIGLHNHKYFILFLVYTSTAALYATILTGYYSVNPLRASGQHYDLRSQVVVFQTFAPLAAMVGFCAWAGTMALLFWQLRLMLRNQTSLEAVRDDVDTPYAQTWLLNVMTVMGPSPWLWLVPLREDRNGAAAKRVAKRYKTRSR